MTNITGINSKVKLRAYVDPLAPTPASAQEFSSGLLRIAQHIPSNN